MLGRKCLLVIFLFGLATNLQARYQVTLILKQVPANKTGIIYASGNFNNWNPADSLYQAKSVANNQIIIFYSQKQIVLEFKFTRGDWKKVEVAAGGKQRNNRTILVMSDTTVFCTIDDWNDTYSNDDKAHTATAQVHLLAEEFPLKILGRSRRIFMYLPLDYETSGKYYPVIYMQDGQNLFDNYYAAFGEWGVDKMMNAFQKDSGRSCIIVGISNAAELRINEYNPYVTDKFGDGMGKLYVKSLVEDVKPFIDSHFRTKKNAANTWIAGSSMGGLISMYAVMAYPKTFGGAGILSPSFWMAPDLFTEAPLMLRGYRGKLFFYCGGQESITAVPNMDRMIHSIKIHSKATILRRVEEGAGHNEASWSRIYPEFIQFVLPR